MSDLAGNGVPPDAVPARVEAAAQSPATFAEVMAMARVFIESGLFPDVRSVAKAAVKIMAGRELGFGPFASMSGVHVVAGKAEPGASLLAALVKRNGRYDYRVAKITNDACEIVFLEHGREIGVSSFTADDARRAGTQNMGKFPRNMLFARALTNGIKWFCPDVESGVAVYAPGEVGGWAAAGEPPAAAHPAAVDAEDQTLQGALAERAPKAAREQLDRISDLAGRLNIDPGRALAKLARKYGVGAWEELTPEQAGDIEAKLANALAPAAPGEAARPA